jgi:hypothetical protein
MKYQSLRASLFLYNFGVARRLAGSLLASLRDAARFFVFSGGVARGLAQPPATDLASLRLARSTKLRAGTTHFALAHRLTQDGSPDNLRPLRKEGLTQKLRHPEQARRKSLFSKGVWSERVEGPRFLTEPRRAQRGRVEKRQSTALGITKPARIRSLFVPASWVLRLRLGIGLGEKEASRSPSLRMTEFLKRRFSRRSQVVRATVIACVIF